MVYVVIMAGGTGGHVMPALAVAEWLRAKGVDVRWLGTRRGLEARLVPERGFPISYLAISGLRGKGMLSWLVAPLKLVVACSQAFAVLIKQRPDAVLGMGGFVTGPGGLVAWLMRLPLVVHEQNAIAGLSNRLLSRFAERVLEAFPDTFPTNGKVRCTGNPVRADIVGIEDPQQRIDTSRAALRVLVVGGSQGAVALNELVPEAIAGLGADIVCEVWHQCGQRDYTRTLQRYRELGVDVRLEPFVADMATAYRWADLVICRAGALTIAELAAAGLPAVLVPYPFAVDDHQTANARYLTKAGAAVLEPQTTLTVDRLRELLASFHDAQGRQRLLAMACAARDLARPEATAEVGQQIMEVACG